MVEVLGYNGLNLTTMTYTPEILEYLLAHYSQRLIEERIKGNTEAVAFLRKQLYQLKNNPCNSHLR